MKRSTGSDGCVAAAFTRTTFIPGPKITTNSGASSRIVQMNSLSIMSGDANKEYGSPANERPSAVKLMRQTCILIRLLVSELEKNKGFVESESGTESDFILGTKIKTLIVFISYLLKSLSIEIKLIRYHKLSIIFRLCNKRQSCATGG